MTMKAAWTLMKILSLSLGFDVDWAVGEEDEEHASHDFQEVRVKMASLGVGLEGHNLWPRNSSSLTLSPKLVLTWIFSVSPKGFR